ncbi:phospholipase D3 [Pelomyxa schiedti]|nr:phospholipase D3 [Pelomyxa schiedti]
MTRSSSATSAVVSLLLIVVALQCCCVSLAVAGSGPKITIVESIPEQLLLPTANSTYEAWMNLMKGASHTLDFAEFYWTLSDGTLVDSLHAGWKGQSIYQEIRQAALQRGVKVRIIQNKPGGPFPGSDPLELMKEGVADVRSLDFRGLSPDISSGIFHTKLIVVDRAHFYLGSANMDWRSLTQVKELGAVVENCPELAKDLMKLFEMWWKASETQTLPKKWFSMFETKYNSKNPAYITFNGNMKSAVYFSVSPPQFVTPGRDSADGTTVDIINRATKYIVMDYRPASLYASTNYYWPEIDDALRSAAFRGVQVRLLVSMWNHTSKGMHQYVNSLNSLNNTSVRWFVVPDMIGSDPVPFTRVNHAKFMVTEKEAYISNNNWTADYFKTTAGVTMVIVSDHISAHLHHKVFSRDWNSPYAHPLRIVNERDIRGG